MLVLQPVSGLHFPAVEALREAILSRALEGTWTGARGTAVTLGPVLPLRTPAWFPQDPTAPPLAVREELATLGPRRSRSISEQRPVGAYSLHATRVTVPNACPLPGSWYSGKKRGLFAL